ncbi:MAG: STAS/SEC14 domain-containing protein [Proteobacteria bacterium]|nr:STAS/SEC14 domain-containing protein [Pseudomonadota bacterium]
MSWPVKALWDDAKVGLHLNSWERIAVVSDVRWIHTPMNAFRFVIPGYVRGYRTSELAEDKQWICE